MACKLISREVVFSENSAPTARCHASTLVAIPGGLACAWFGGPFEGSPLTGIWWSRRISETWLAPELIANVGPEPHWNPVLHLERERLHLFFKVGIYPKRWRTYTSTRLLLGTSFELPRELVPGDVGGRGPVKNKLLRLSNGEWLAPASLETDGAWDCFVDRSSDCGLTWQAEPLVPLEREQFQGAGIIQPVLWESQPGHIHMLARSTEGHVFRSDSADNGHTWCLAYPTSIPNNNSGIDLLLLDNGTLILACNPVEESWGARSPLVLFESTDNGENWEESSVLESGPGEYSYPAIVAIKHGFAVSYTHCRKTIAYCSFTRR